MKIRLLFLLALLYLGAFTLTDLSQVTDSRSYAEIQISTPKAEYLLGEPVRVDLRFTKKGDFEVDFEDANSISAGAFRVFISRDGGEFLRYRFNGWVADRFYPSTQNPPRRYFWKGSDYHSFDTVFLNSKPVIAHLSDYGRREGERGMILTDYAFPEPGEYRLRASLTYSRMVGKKAIAEKVESGEISIRLKQPDGEDLQVWKLIESDVRLGYLMTASWGLSSPPGTPESFLAKVDQIVADHPDSYLAGILKQKAAFWRGRPKDSEQRLPDKAKQD